jgi:hypothetical protein
MYGYWHCGDEHNNIPPMKYLDKNDVKFIGKCANVSLSELRKVMGCIDEAAKTNGCPPNEHMSHTDANSCYLREECGIFAVMPDKTPTGRNRIIANKKWGTVVKYMHKSC